MPLVGLSPFLPRSMNSFAMFNSIVSMPLVGLSPFLRYPLKNLVKSRFVRPFSAHYSQNILKTFKFSPFEMDFCTLLLLFCQSR